MLAEPYSLEQDDDFLFVVYASTRSDEVRAWGLGAAEAAAFLRMQHTLQLASYARAYPQAERWVLQHRGERAGYLAVERTALALRIIDLALLAEHRGRGIGSRAIRQLQDETRCAGAKLVLTVRSDNRARRLYERLGFRVTQTDELQLQMEWSPEQPSELCHSY